MSLVERDEHLTFLTGLLVEAVEGKGRIAVVSGPAATGKSALLDEFAERAHEAGALPLTAIGATEETHLPLGVMGQLLLGAPMPAERRAAVRGLLAAGEDGRRTAAQELTALLLELAERQPLALVVDDVQHADDDSLACLSYLTRRLRSSGIMAVFGRAGRPTTRAVEFLLELLRRPNHHNLVLPLLSPGAVGQLTAERLGGPAGERLAAACHRVSGGNPLLVNSLLDGHLAAVRAATAVEGELTVGDSYGQAVLDLLRRGDPGLLPLAQGVAVLGASGAVDRLLGLDGAKVARGLRELEASGVLTTGGFRHEVARSAVLLDVEAERRAELHRRAAALLHAGGAAAAAIAEHLLAAGPVEEPWVVPVLEEAATLALAEGRVGSAVEYLRLACRVCEDGPRLARIRTALVRAEWRINPSAPTPHLAELTDALHRGHLRPSDGLVLAKALLWHGRFEDARDVLTELQLESELHDPETAAELRTTRPWLRCWYAPFLDYVPEAEEPPRSRALPSTAVSWRLEAATALDSVLSQGPSEQVVAEAERILRSSRLDEMGMDTVESALLALTYGDRAGRAAPWCDGLIEEAISRQSPGRRARLATIRAEISIRQGDLPGAELHARQALEIVPAGSWGVAVGALLASLLTALTAMGRYDEAADQLNLPVPEAMLQSRYGLHYLQARGQYELSSGHLDAALSDFLACGDLMGRWGLDVPGLVAWRGDAAEAMIQLGDQDEARRLLEEQLGMSGPAAPRAWGMAMRQLAATYELRQRPALLRKSADILQEAGDRYELARALSDLARAYHDLGELRRARLTARRAWTLATKCQAQPLTRLLGAKFDWNGAEPTLQEPGAADGILSDAERRVAELAAHGYTNREIAKRLYVTVSTVEQHLTRAYRKLHVTSRADLPTAMASLVRTG
ncbi:helix-turn-helix transcriptional regulator [Streptosporangium saharense]|uniref:helix-turn-helix transcriptional regulator n=1 Tax=Streptosporangium saharense TaxID=1706840 RepID=UPI0036B91F82